MNCSKIETPNWMAPEGEDCNSSISTPPHSTQNNKIYGNSANVQMCHPSKLSQTPGRCDDIAVSVATGYA